MKTRNPILPLAAAAMACFAMTTSANAVTITDTGNLGVPSAATNAQAIAVLPVGTGDLLESATTVNLSGGLAFSSQLKNINDGLAVSNSGTADSTTNLFAVSNGGKVEFVLDAAYDIGQIDVFSLWAADRTAHKYSIEVSTDGGSSYSALTSVDEPDGSAPSPDRAIRRVRLTDGGGVLASGINAIQFTFNDSHVSVFTEIDVYGGPATNDPPTDITLTGYDLFPGLPVGTEFATLASVDAPDTHTYALVVNPGGVFAIDGDQLELAASPGSVGTNYMIRLRTTDSAMQSFEKDFTVSVAAAADPTDITLSANGVNAVSPPGAFVATITTADANVGDVPGYSLVAGPGDTDNSIFTIANGNELRLASPVPGGATNLTIRLRSTDLAGGFVEKSFILTVQDPSFLIGEFLASNVNGLQDEDLEFSDWIEIHNDQAFTANLVGWYLTDDPNNLTKWQFPSVEVLADGRLVVFASGKDRAITGMELHTNFALASSGDYLALVMPDGVTIADQFSFGAQYPDISFGYDAGSTAQGFLLPTPEAANGAAFAFGLNEVSFSSERGFYDSAFSLSLTATVPGSTIRFTTNGTKPSATSGTIYGGAIPISPGTGSSNRGSRIVRAVAINASAAVAPVNTHTYLFVNGVTAPATDGLVGQITLQSSITSHPTYGPLMDDALLAQPAISIVGGLPVSDTVEVERSVEFFTPDGSEPGFHIDCGMKVVGGHSIGSPKNNFRLYFRSEYGTSKLRHDVFKDHPYTLGAADVFDRLNLRSGSHDSFFWLANPGFPPTSGGPEKGDAQYIRNRWISDMQLLMGHESIHGRWVHLYVNGSYHGQYYLHEWPNDDFLGSYLPGPAEDYEYTNGASTAKSGSDNWQAVWATMKSAAGTSFAAAREWIDLENLADYQLLNFYAGNPWDWNPNQNWMAGGPNVPNSPSGGWKFFNWDSDICLQDPGANVLAKNVPDGVFQSLMNDEDFRVLFRDRVYKHCFHDGVLTPTRVAQSHTYRADEIRTSIVAETARWQGSAANPPWDRDDEWQTELDRMAGYFLVRTDNLLNQLRAQSNWYPLEAPEFGVRGGFVAAGYTPSLTAPTGTIYYTTDGSDPRLPGGAINPNASAFSNGSIVINSATVVRTRVWDGTTWSALNEAGFITIGTQLANTSNITVSEIHYHPQDAKEYEFLEFKNTSATVVDLTGVTISGGINFSFPLGSVLDPGAHLVVVADLAQFTARYASPGSPWYFPGIAVAGVWSGSLSNGGEALIVTDSSGHPLLTVNYDDSGAWPGRADGRGSAAELRDPSAIALALPDKNLDLDAGGSWRPTSEFHGSPGRDGAGPDNRVVFNEILTNSDPPDPDAFELLNTQGSALGIGGWFVSDDADDYKKYRIPTGTTIGGAAMLVFDENTFNNPADPDSLVPFALNGSEGDDLFLLEPDASGNLLRFVDRAEFGAAATGESFGRWPDGSSGELYPMLTQTFGELNSFGGNTVRVGPVVVAEMHYNPDGADDGREFIAICNAGTVSENLENWRLRGEVDFDFTSATSLAPGAFLVLVDFDPADSVALNAFRSEYGLDPLVPVLGPWNNGGTVPTKLNDGGGTVRLLRPDALVIPGDGSPSFYPMLIEDLVNYNDIAPWPLSPDGAGDSLQRVNVSVYGDDPFNWTGSATPLGGVSYETWAANAFLPGTPAADQLAGADPDHDGLTNFGEFAFYLDPLSSNGPPPSVIETTSPAEAILLRFRSRPAAHGLSYTSGLSTDLINWDFSENDLEFVSAILQPDGSVEVTMRYQPSPPMPSSLFFRVQVTGS